MVRGVYGSRQRAKEPKSQKASKRSKARPDEIRLLVRTRLRRGRRTARITRPERERALAASVVVVVVVNGGNAWKAVESGEVNYVALRLLLLPALTTLPTLPSDRSPCLRRGVRDNRITSLPYSNRALASTWLKQAAGAKRARFDMCHGCSRQFSVARHESR